MEPIGNDGLTCISDTDYAAYALYLQCQAEQIDTLLSAQLEALTDFLSQPTIVVYNPLVRNMAAGASVSIFNLFTTVLYNNSDFMSLVVDVPNARNYIQIGSAAGADPVVPYRRGTYMIGGVTGMTPTGAVTAASARRLSIAVSDLTSITSTLIGNTEDTTYETGTTATIGPITQSPVGTFQLSGISGVVVLPESFHANAASTVNVAAGSVMWVTYLGPDNLVEVS